MSQEDEASNLTNAAAIAEARATATGASAANAVGETAPQEPKEAAATESGVTTAEAGTTGAGAVNAMGEAAPEEASNTAAVVNATVEEAPEVPKETDREEPAPVASGEPEALGEIPANEQVQAVETASRAARTYSKEVVQRARQASKEAQAAEEEAEAVESAGRAARTYSKEVVQRARQASKEAQAAEEEAEAVETAGRAARTYSKEVVQRARQASKEAQAADEEAQALEAASRAARTYSKEVVQRVCQDIETAKEESIAVREAAAEAEVADARGEAAREDAETAVAEDSQSPEAEASVGEQDQEAAEETPAEEMPAEEEPSDVQEDSPQTEETDDSGWKDTKDEPKEITWSSLSVATDDVQESLETAVQYTSMAQNLRAKGLIPRAIRMMERALMITQRSELEHPSLALEACKVRLNFAAYLSEGYRHREALKVIKEAQENLMRLVHWALQCPPEDLAVQALGKEARALHCSAVVAEAVALEFFEDDGKPPPDEMPEDLKEMARMTGASMPPDHPLPWLVRQTLGSSAASRASNHKRSVLAEIKRMSVSNMPLTPSPGEELTAPAADLPKPEPEKQKKRLDELPRPKRGPEDRDVFKQYLRDREMARVAHLLALSDDWETQTRKKLEEVHRQAKFEMELVNVDELKEKRYSRLGHKVFMHQMRKMNRCWSDPTLSREARREKTAPEIHQLKKLSRKIYVKPPATQAPAPPPPKPKVDSSLAGSMKAMREEHA